MSHMKLSLILSTDSDAVNESRHLNGATATLAEFVDKIAQQLRAGRHDGQVRDANGNTIGNWHVDEVVDTVTRASCGHPAYRYRENMCSEMTCRNYAGRKLS